MSSPLVVSILFKGDATGVSPAAKATKAELSGVETGANAANDAFVRWNFTALKHRTVLGQTAQATKLQAHEVTNLTYQLNDVGTMLAAGQSPFMLMMQQGTQVSQIMGKRGLLQIIPAIGQGMLSLLSPFNLAMAGVLAFGYAGYAAFRKISPEVEPLNDLLARQSDILAKLRQSYLDVGNASKTGWKESQTGLLADLEATRRQTQKSLEGEFQRLTNNQPDTVDNFGNPTDPKLNKYALLSIYNDPVDAALAKLKDSGDQVNDKFTVFRATLAAIATDKTLDVAVKEKADAFRKLALEAAQAEQQIKLAVSPGDRATGNRAERDMGGYSAFLQQQDVTLRRMREASAASLLGVNARSPEERAAAARAAASAQINSGESQSVRSLRIELAATEALIKAKHDIAEAEKARKRALDETISSAELDLSLVGQSAAEVARLKMEHQLLGEAMKDAAEKGIQASEAELELIRQKSAEYARLKTLTDARSFIQSKNEELAKLRLEQQLIGANATVQARAMAAYEAELEIRHRGLDLNSAEAQAIRDKSAAIAEVTSQLSRQKDAWGKVQNAGQSAIDMLVDGDFNGALKEVEKTLLDIAVKAPLKNALLGTNEGTLADLGGFTGLIAKLFGGANDNAASAVSSAVGSSVGAMNVTAASVIINGGAGGIAGLLGDAFKPNTTLGALIGNDNAAGSAAGKVAGGGVAGQAWNFFAGKGLKDFQAAAVLGHMKVESGFDPLAVGDHGNAFGLFQHNDRKNSLFNFIGGKGQLGSVQKQLEFAWSELQGSENGALKKLLGSGNLLDATKAFGAFERPSGYSAQNPEAMSNFVSRLKGAQEALTKFGGTTASTNSALGTMANGLTGMGNGLNKFGTTLANASTGSASGGGGFFSFLSKLFGGGGSNISPGLNSVIASGGEGLFAGGGDIWGPGTGTSDSIPILASNGEFMVRARQAAKYRPLLHAINNDQLGHYAEGGFISRYASPRAGGGSGNYGVAASSPNITFVNNGTAQRIVDQREEDDGQGGRRHVFVLDDANAGNIARPGSATGRALKTAFGAPRKTAMR